MSGIWENLREGIDIPEVDREVLRSVIKPRGELTPLEKTRTEVILLLVERSPAWQAAYRELVVEDARAFAANNRIESDEEERVDEQ